MVESLLSGFGSSSLAVPLAVLRKTPAFCGVAWTMIVADRPFGRSPIWQKREALPLQLP